MKKLYICWRYTCSSNQTVPFCSFLLDDPNLHWVTFTIEPLKPNIITFRSSWEKCFLSQHNLNLTPLFFNCFLKNISYWFERGTERERERETSIMRIIDLLRLHGIETTTRACDQKWTQNSSVRGPTLYPLSQTG